MPTVENKIAKIGMATTPPMKRGASTRTFGSIAIISIAASCSPAFISPISAVSDVPALPANSRPVTTGPSSRTSDRLTISPSDSVAP